MGVNQSEIHIYGVCWNRNEGQKTGIEAAMNGLTDIICPLSIHTPALEVNGERIN